MKTSTKKWLRIACSLVVLGLIMFLVALLADGWDFKKLGTETYVTNTYSIDEDFENISVHVSEANVVFQSSDDGTCTVLCYETENVKHTAAVKDGQLTIQTTDTRKWYDHISIDLDSPKITVTLPRDQYATVSVSSGSGNVHLPNDFAFGTLTVRCGSGNIDCRASVSGDVQMETGSGNIRLENASLGQTTLSAGSGSIALTDVDGQAGLEIHIGSGNIKLTDVHCADLKTTAGSGNTSLTNVIATGSFSIQSGSGNVHFDGCDATEIFAKASSGNIRGTLLSEKVFYAQTGSGRASVPKGTNGGLCELTTGSGDIQIEIK